MKEQQEMELQIVPDQSTKDKCNNIRGIEKNYIYNTQANNEEEINEQKRQVNQLINLFYFFVVNF